MCHCWRTTQNLTAYRCNVLYRLVSQRDDVPFDACLCVFGLCFGYGAECHCKRAVLEWMAVLGTILRRISVSDGTCTSDARGYVTLAFRIQAASHCLLAGTPCGLW